MPELTILTALSIEALAVGGPTTVVGMGPANAATAGARLAGTLPAGAPVAVTGVGGGISPDLRSGQVVVASEVRTLEPGGPTVVPLPGARLVADELARVGLAVRIGPVASSPRLLSRRQRAALAGSGALLVDMESGWLARQLAGHPLAVVRVAADSAEHGPVRGGLRTIGPLMGIRPPLERWARALGQRQVLLAGPRSFCAGVERAVDIVERALARFGSPVYVRRQIVHNRHVVAGLQRRGAVFVEEVDEVPVGATCVLAAHGVAPEVHLQAERRHLNVIDATCPLVAKVHAEARRFARQGRQLVLIGHGDHEEVVGTMGEAPKRTHLVETVADVEHLPLRRDEPVAYLTQTTLAVDETASIVSALEERFSDVTGPPASDICYATQNRQDAVAALAARCDLLLVVGSPNSSNTVRLVEVARRRGCRAELVDDERHLQLSWLDGVTTVGITAGASAPEWLVQRVVDRLGLLGPLDVREQRITTETVEFSLPQKVR